MSTAPLTVSEVRAVTRLVDPPRDVLDALDPHGFAWSHDGFELATAGVAATVHPDDAVAFLAAIDHDDDAGMPATGPLAVGGLPFDPTASRELVVPRRIVGRLPDGQGWVTHIGAPVEVPASGGAEPARFAVEERMSRGQWCVAVTRALDAIARGDLEKVVLARQVDVVADWTFDVRVVLARLRREQPGCFVYAAGGLVGATPELLVRRRGRCVESRPMAGTGIGSDDASLARLHDSEKDAREHRPVAAAIAEALAPWCEHLEMPREPEVARFASVAHLATPVQGRLVEPAPDACRLVAALHPTPAVGGTPTSAALRTIAALEPDDRGRYAGPVGWMDARGDGDWGVALRGATIDGPRARLAAGAGIVAGSDPDAEWRETGAKLEPMLRALRVVTR